MPTIPGPTNYAAEMQQPVHKPGMQTAVNRAPQAAQSKQFLQTAIAATNGGPGSPATSTAPKTK